VGRLVCGCWGRRNFNVWTLCADCAAGPPLTLVATFAGPAYSFAVIWAGYVLLGSASVHRASVGLALVISSMPVSRILTPIVGGGDEIFGLVRLGLSRTLAWPLAVCLVLTLAVPPVVRISRRIDARRKGAWIAGLLLAPFLLVGVVVFGVLQTLLLGNGVLAHTGILGSPVIVTAWLCLSAAAVLALRRQLGTLLVPAG
jgi:hypothetical protein